ncbi:septum formation inhibitor Maf [Jejudonia soesokkakensis]|uniref:Septum formation inhibitor Maf n=1 Tax=Jejudonia soesokkakensis TaxID=1323432 RepID=A0ABW2MXP4_9FLAO
MRTETTVATLFLAFLFLMSCDTSEKNLIPSSNPEGSSSNQKQRSLSKQFKDYWYDGTAEITSYQLTQERYGELREGTAVTIFVTEDFIPKAQVKADQASEENIPVLKLNAVKKFVTGIYPYSIMTSTFSPIPTEEHALKVTNSVQEWCGQTYLQLNSRSEFELTGHSYFASEGDFETTLEKTWLEDELWNRIRINPEELPTGDVSMIPSFEFLRLRHKEAMAYKGYAKLQQRDSLTSYSIEYPEIQRSLIIYFNSTFPFEIEKWEETNASQSLDSTSLKTSAVRLRRIEAAYWEQNKNKDRTLRDSLELK